MAGLDDGFTGEARLTPGFSVGYLPRSPQLDPTKDVVGNVADGIAEQRDLLIRFNEVCAAMADPDADFDALLTEQADLQTKIDAANAWDLERTLDIAMDALRLPPADADVTMLSGGERRRVALCRLLLSKPDLVVARRTDEPSRRRIGRVARANPPGLQRHRRRDHPRSLLPRQCRAWILELDRGHGIPWEGNYSSWLEQKQARLAQEEKSDKVRQAALERELEWIRMSPRARQSKGKARLSAFNELVAESESAERRADRLEIAIPPGPRLGDVVVNAERYRQGVRRRLLIEDLNFLLPPGGIVGVIGANGAGKTTLFRMMLGQEKPDAGRFEVGSTVRSPTSISRATTSTPMPRSSMRSARARNRWWSARARSTRAPTLRVSASRAATSRRRWARSAGGERNRVQLAKVLRSGGQRAAPRRTDE